MSSAVLIFVIILGAVGTSLLFIGWLFSLLIALGHKQYIFSIAILAIIPAHIYCALHWGKAAHAGKMLYSGTALLLITLGIFAVHDFQMFPPPSTRV